MDNREKIEELEVMMDSQTKILELEEKLYRAIERNFKVAFFSMSIGIIIGSWA